MQNDYVECACILSIENKVLIILKYSAGHHDLQRSKTLISPSNVAQNAKPGTVLETAGPEDSKTPPTC